MRNPGAVHLLAVLIAAFIAVAAATPAAAVRITAGTGVGLAGQPVDIDIMASDLTGLGVLSYQFALSYNASLVTAVDVLEAGSLPQAASWGEATFNVTSGQITVSHAGTTAMSGGGPLCRIRFQISPAALSGGATTLSFVSHLLNEGVPPDTVTNGQITINATPAITVSPNTGEVVRGLTLQFTVGGSVSNPVTWSLTNPAIATISSSGLLTGVAPGSVRVFVVDNAGRRDTTDDDIQIRGMQVTIGTGSALQGQVGSVPVTVTDLSGLGIRAGQLTVSFDSSLVKAQGATATGTMLDGYGLVQFGTAGNTLTVDFAGTSDLGGAGTLCFLNFLGATSRSGSSSLTLADALFNETLPAKRANGSFVVTPLPSITVTPENVTLLAGQTQQFSVSGSVTPPPTWSTLDPRVATISSSGLLTAVAGGVTRVRVRDAVGVTDENTSVTVYDFKISLPTLDVHAGSIVNVPLTLDRDVSGLGILSVQYTLTHSASVVAGARALASGLVSAWGPPTGNAQSGYISVAAAGTQPLGSWSNELSVVELQIAPHVSVNTTVPLTLPAVTFNEGLPVAQLVSGSLRVTGTNRPPVVDSIPDQAAMENSLLTVVPHGTDADGDPLTWSGSNLPSGGSVDPSSGVFRWTPGFAQAGTYPGVTLRASDGFGGTASRSFTIRVTDVNGPPVVSSIPDQTVAENALLTVVPVASDPDGDTLSWLGSNLPAGAAVDPVLGTFRWTPDFTQAGAYSGVTLSAADGHGGVGVASFKITVVNVNRAPVLDSIPDQTVTAGDTLVVMPRAHDPDGDPLSWSGLRIPPGATLNAQSGVLTWTPTLAQVGDYPNVTLLVSDGQGAGATASFSITVVKLNLPPETEIVTGPMEGSHLATSTVTFKWSGGDDFTPTDGLEYATRMDDSLWSGFGPDTTRTFVDLAEGPHRFEVKARDQDGVEDPAPAVRDFAIDLTPPTSVFQSVPEGGWARNSDVGFAWSGTDNLAPPESLTYATRIDEEDPPTPFDRATVRIVHGLGAGPHVFRVWARDLARNVQPDTLSVSFRVDLVAPETWLLSGPADSAVVGASPVTFGWGGSDDQAPAETLTFAHRMDDGGSFSAFTGDTSHVFSGLSDGWHTLQVKARDVAKNEDQTPVARTFRVDRTPPVVSFTTAPEENEHRSTRHAEFAWDPTDNVTSPEAVLSAFSLDAGDTTAFSADVRSATYDGLAEGLHSFLVLAKDQVGNLGTATRSFGVDLTPPTTSIVAGPADGGLVSSTTVTFRWTGSDNLSPVALLEYSWQMDTTAWSSFDTTTSHRFDSLAVQQHTFRVRARDLAGNVDSVGVSSTFRFDFDAPLTQIVAGPAEGAHLRANSFTFIWTGSDAQTPRSALKFSWKLDTGSYSSPSSDSSHSFTGVSDGAHTFRVKAIDSALNEDREPPSRTFATDITPPQVAFTKGPEPGGAIQNDSTSIAWDGTDGVTSSPSLQYAFRLDVGPESPFDSIRTAVLTRLAEGNHAFRVRVRDLAGNIGSSTLSFGIDFTPPNSAIISGPQNGGWSPMRSVTLGWTGTDNLAPPQELVFAYKMDADSFSTFGAATSHTFSGLSDGSHTLLVKARDRSGREDPTPAAITFNVGLVDLSTTAVTVPSSTDFNTSIPVTWTVRNNGNGPVVGTWSDLIYFSSDSLAGGDVLLKAHTRTDSLPGGSSYTAADSVKIPFGSARRGWIVVVADGGGMIPEDGAEDNNARVSDQSIALAVPPHPDLVVSSVVPPATGFSGQGVYVDWTVRNAGGVKAQGPWTDHVFLSADSLIGGDTPLIPSFTYNFALEAGVTYTHSHPVVFPPNIEGRFWLVVAADGPDAVEEYGDEGNNVAVSAQSILIQRTPFPDLRVDSVAAPPSADAGSRIQTRWIVGNQGQAPTSAPVWYDRVYLSHDAVYDDADVYLGRFPNQGYLNPGDAYVSTANVTLPTNISGGYRILVMADADKNVDEHNDEGNNYVASAAFDVRFVAAPYCNLEVTYFTPVLTAWSGQPLQLTWTLKNVGTAPLESYSWDDALGLSTDSSFQKTVWFQSHYYRHLDHFLVPGDSTTLSASVPLPSGISGDYYLFVQPATHTSINAGGCTGMPFGRPITIRSTPPPDLEVRSVAAAVDSAFMGGSLRVRWSVLNNGPGPSGTSIWQDSLYISDDDAFDPGTDLPLGGRTHSGYLNVEEHYDDSLDVVLPANRSGSFYLFLSSDAGGQVSEGPYETNNVARSATPLEIVLPPVADLAVRALAAPAVVGSGDSLLVQWSVENLGPASTAASGWNDVLYFSADSMRGSGVDSLIGIVRRVGGLSAGAQYAASMRFRVPDGLSGQRYLHVLLDSEGQVYQGAARANDGRACPVTVTLTPPPDLVVTRLLTPSTARAGEPTAVQWEVKNVGAGPTRAATWRDTLYLSRDSVLTSDDLALTSAVHTGILGTSAGYLQNRDVTLPAESSGAYFLIARADADNAVYEHLGEGNNCRAVSIDVESSTPALADLALLSFEFLSFNPSGASATVRWTAQNRGSASTSTPWLDAVYLSDDPVWGAGSDPVVGTVTHTDRLDAGGSYTSVCTVRLAKGVFGPRYLLLRLDSDNRIAESDEANGTGAVAIDIPQTPADLVVTEIAAPESVNTGQSVTIAWTVRNAGTGSTEAASWSDAVYLSRDLLLDVSDVSLGSEKRAGALAPDSSYWAARSATVPAGLAGPYYVIVQTDQANEVYEYAGEDNNLTISSAPVRIVIPPRVDLQVASVQADTAAFAGDSVTVSWTVRNSTVDAAVGDWLDAVYLSPDSLPSADDVLLGTVNHSGGLGGGMEYTARLAALDLVYVGSLLAALPGVPEGGYRILVRTDIRNVVPEFDENNNALSTPGNLQASVRILEPGAQTAGTLAPQAAAYFRLDVPDSSDLQVRLASDGPASPLRLFVRHGQVPSPLKYDVTFTMDNSETTAVVRGVGPGSYYLTLEPGVTAGPALAYHLSVVLVGFSVQSVFPTQVGNAGSVTLALAGTGFEKGLRATLVDAGGRSIEAASLLYEDRIRVYPTFDLTDASPGPATIQVSNRDSTTVALMHAIEVVQGGEPHVFVQLGAAQSAARVGHDGQVTVEYGNDGLVDAKVPVFQVRVGSGVRLHLVGGESGTELLRVVGISQTGPASVLRPGSVFQVPVVVERFPAGRFELRVGTVPEAFLVGWEEVRGRAGPDWPSPETSIAFWDTLASAGISTWRDLADAAADYADLLAVGGIHVFDLDFYYSILITASLDMSAAFREGSGSLAAQPPRTETVMGLRELWERWWGEGTFPIITTALTTVASTASLGSTAASLSPLIDGMLPVARYFFSIYLSSLTATLDYNNDSSAPLKAMFIRDLIEYVASGKKPPGFNWVLPATADQSLTVASLYGVSESDPNEKTGTRGAAGDGVVLASESIDYTVYFENTPTATAPAWQVEIRDTLDPSLDWRSLRLTDIVAGERKIQMPDGRSYMQSSTGLGDGNRLDVEAGLDARSGEVRWLFTTRDSSTGLAPRDPFAGFLPPNDSTGRGEGHVSFAVKPKAGLVPGTVVRNQAHIRFGELEDLATNEVRNVLVHGSPDLVVASLRVDDSGGGVIEGEAVKLLARVRNAGQSSADTVTVGFFDAPGGAGGSLGGSADLSGSILSGEERDVALMWLPHRVLGDRTLQVTADPADSIAESDETNNSRAVTLRVAPRARTVHLASGVNLMAPPLEPEQALSARALAALVGTSVVVGLDSLGHFQTWVPDLSDDGFAVAGPQSYLVAVDGPRTATFEGMTHRDSLLVAKDLNMLSLPLDPLRDYTARDLCAAIGARTLIRYDVAQERFDAFLPAFHQGNGFSITGGAGYIAVTDSQRIAVFSGKGWRGEGPTPPVSAAIAQPSGATAGGGGAVLFGVAGDVSTLGGWSAPVPVPKGCRVSATQRGAARTVETDLNPRTSQYAAVFVDFSNQQVVRAGDMIDVVVRMPDGSVAGDTTHYVVTPEDLKRHYAHVNLTMPVPPPAVTLLRESAPNPFGVATHIRFQLARGGKVSLKVYDVAGRLVKVLVDGPLRPGYYEEVWDGGRHGGQSASGVYFIRLEAPGYGSNRKVVLIRGAGGAP